MEPYPVERACRGVPLGVLAFLPLHPAQVSILGAAVPQPLSFNRVPNGPRGVGRDLTSDVGAA